MNSVLSDEKKRDTRKLQEQMDAFYASCPTYSAFREPSDARQEWDHVNAAILEHDGSKGRCRVLEFGAGRSGFAGFLGGQRNSVDLTMQDITSVNEEILRAGSDHVHLGSLFALEGEFDVIFSTFVLEHICQPERTLRKLMTLLAPGGSLYLFCPRYDFPFFISHSADHYGKARRSHWPYTLEQWKIRKPRLFRHWNMRGLAKDLVLGNFEAGSDSVELNDFRLVEHRLPGRAVSIHPFHDVNFLAGSFNQIAEEGLLVFRKVHGPSVGWRAAQGSRIAAPARSFVAQSARFPNPSVIF